MVSRHLCKQVNTLKVFGVLRAKEGNIVRGRFERDEIRMMENSWEQEQEKLKKTCRDCKFNIAASPVYLEP